LAGNEQFRSRRKDHERKIEQVCTSIRSARYANPEDERNVLVYGNFPIAPHQTLEVEVVFTFFPSIGRAPEPIISDVIFTTDNSENQHSVRAKFTYGLNLARPFHPKGRNAVNVAKLPELLRKP
jgi:hypothetical protein